MNKNSQTNMSSNTASGIQAEIEYLLTSALPDENLNDYQVEIVGTTEKGAGFSGDIYFVNLKSKNKNLNFVMKCGKHRSAPFQDGFHNEIYMYKVVFPAFRKFEIQRNINDAFDSLPKCYGTFISPDKEVLVLENLKSLGYGLWDKKLPLPRNYIEAILKLYGRWHAISAAIQDQEPAKFQELTNNLIDVGTSIFTSTNIENIFLDSVEFIVKIWENDVDETILNQWRTFLDHAKFYLNNSRKKKKYFNVITHGDCWNNNFLFNTADNELKVAILDWQISAFTSPVVDISYFLYAVISEKDLEDFDDLLKLYYKSFTEHLTKLGSNPDMIYSYTNFRNDWTRYARIGLIHGALSCRMAPLDKENAPDGTNISDAFSSVVKDLDCIKKRSKCLIYHAVERDLIRPIDDF